MDRHAGAVLGQRHCTGNGLGTLSACADRTVILTGTLLGGYATDVYNLLFRVDAPKIVAHGYEWGEAGLRSFAETYGVLERVTTIVPADNSCLKWRVTKQVKRKPGASPLLFSEFLMGLAAFVSLEDGALATAIIKPELTPVIDDVPPTTPLVTPECAGGQCSEVRIATAINTPPQAK